MKVSAKNGWAFYFIRRPYESPVEGRGKITPTSSGGQGNLMLPRGEMPDSVVGIIVTRGIAKFLCSQNAFLVLICSTVSLWFILYRIPSANSGQLAKYSDIAFTTVS